MVGGRREMYVVPMAHGPVRLPAGGVGMRCMWMTWLYDLAVWDDLAVCMT